VTTEYDITPEDQRSLSRATLRGAMWITVGRFLKAPTNLIVVAVLARLLTPADFGVVGMGLIVVSLANLLVDGTFGMVLVQRPKVDPPLIGASLLLSAALGAVFGVTLIAAGPIIQAYFEFPQLSAVLRTMAMVLPTSAAMAVTTGLLQRASRFRVLMINSWIAQIIYGLVAVVLAVMGLGLWSLVWGQVVSACLEAFLGYLAVRSGYRVGLSRRAVRDAFRTGGMFTISKLFNWAAGNVDNIVIGRLLGAAPLGLYSRANTLMNTVNQLVGTGSARVLFSTFAKMQHDLERMRRAFERALSTSLVGSTLASAFIIMFADLIVRVLLGPKWLAAVPILQVLFAAFITRSGYLVAEAVPLALGLGRASAFRQAVQFLLIIAGAVTGSRFGLLGAAIGIASAYWIFYLLCLLLVHQLLGVGILQLVKLHLRVLPAVAMPVAVTAAVRFALPASPGLAAEAALTILFCSVSALVISFAPAALLSYDIVRLRQHAFALTASRLRILAGTN
jgi:PST family polysaccharide transporter